MNKENLDACIKWAKDNGAYINDNLSFKLTDNSGISVFLLNDISLNSNSIDSLINIPENLFITNEMAENYFNLNSSISDNSLIQLYLSKLKFDNSMNNDSIKLKFLPYLNLLNKDILINFPYFYSTEILKLINGTDLKLKIKKNLKKNLTEWLNLINLLKIDSYNNEFLILNKLNDDELLDYIFKSYQSFQNSNLLPWNSFIAYLWSYCIFTSRAFPEFLLNNNNNTNLNKAFLLPIVDLLNHENNSQVKWDFNSDKKLFQFKINNNENILKKGNQLFNNYGDKSNEDLLLNYGFQLKKNEFDFISLTLRLTKETLIDCKKWSNKILNDSNIIDEEKGIVEFKLPNNTELFNPNLIDFFAFLNKLRSENFQTFRATLDGSNQLLQIFDQKLQFFKDLSKNIGNKNNDIKLYSNSQKNLYLQNYEFLQKYQKILLTKQDPTLQKFMFKTAFKNDKLFNNSILLSFGIVNFEKLISDTTLLNKVLLLWVVRIMNLKELNSNLGFEIPNFIYDTFLEISESIKIDESDVIDMLDTYKELFPKLANNIPEVYGNGNWKIRQFIIADVLLDRLVWKKSQNNEPIFIEKKEFKRK